MEIRFSRYNQPFTESGSPGVHYISLDDQLDMRAGRYYSHIQVFNAISRPRTLDVFDPLTGTTITHDLAGSGFFRPFNSSPTVNTFSVDPEFVLQLKAAGIKSASALLSSCSCRRPWRCVCKK